MLEMALVENVQRVDLSPIDRAKGFERLMNEFALTTSEIAARIGKSVAYVSNSMRLLSLPDALKDGLLSGLISEGHARALAAIDDQSLMIEAYKIILREAGSVRRAEDLARRMKAKSKQIPKGKANIAQVRIVSNELDRIQDEMKKVLRLSEDDSTTVVKVARSRRETRITLTFKGKLEETEERFQKVYRAITKKKPKKIISD